MIMLYGTDWLASVELEKLIIEEHKGSECFHLEESLILEVRNIERLMQMIGGSEEPLFFFDSLKEGAVICRKFGRSLYTLLRRGVVTITHTLPYHEMNPYVEVYFKHVDKLSSFCEFWPVDAMRGKVAESFVLAANDLVSELRCELSSADFKSILKRFKRASLKRTKGLERYIDDLFQQHARMLVLRIDLSYEGGYLSGRLDFDSDISAVKRHWSKMQTDLHKGKPVSGLLGFVCKLEYGHLKGFHFHLLLFYSGSEHRQDGGLARMIGEHWKNSVTEGRGRFYNCNANKQRYKNVGIGMISYDQSDRIDVLKNKVGAYLTKVDYWVRLSPSVGRSFSKGNSPKLSATKRGRKRSDGQIPRTRDV
ncbi:inovirus-type Gp2 protein [Pseudomonas sp. JUb52]|uniref:YagK/YfjJ domain-containing protein n=1 Tax=Pseudomonas sp. JUb52 TaxID=2485127 RepID=UPI00140476E3|nr:inovirus-type Gp2 protein [Pseudomonas sp. JUb52]